jgi:hypothetical protein
MDDETWVREALMYVMLTHLQGSLAWLLRSLEQTLAPVGSKPNESVNVAFLLQTLGFNLGEADALAALDQNFDDAFKAPAT